MEEEDTGEERHKGNNAKQNDLLEEEQEWKEEELQAARCLV